MKCSQPNAKHRFAFLRLKFTVSFFSLPCKRLENTRKALKIKPFVLFRAKSWFRINGRERISGLTLPTFCRLAHNVSARPLFKASFWGLENEPQKLSLCNQRKASASVPKNQWVILTHWYLRFSPLSEIQFTKSSLKKVAKYGKIKASQKKEVL